MKDYDIIRSNDRFVVTACGEPQLSFGTLSDAERVLAEVEELSRRVVFRLPTAEREVA